MGCAMFNNSEFTEENENDREFFSCRTTGFDSVYFDCDCADPRGY